MPASPARRVVVLATLLCAAGATAADRCDPIRAHIANSRNSRIQDLNNWQRALETCERSGSANISNGGATVVASASPAPQQPTAENRTGAHKVFMHAFKLFHSGDFDAAVILFKQGLELEPDSAHGHFFLTETYQRLDRRIPAREHYEHAVRLAPDQGVIASQFNVGHGYQNGIGVGKDALQARAWFQKVIAHPANDPAAQRYKAGAQQRLSELGTATK